MTCVYTKEEKQSRDSRYNILKSNLKYLSKQPRVLVLYPMMDTTVYQDFEVLIATFIEEFDPAND